MNVHDLIELATAELENGEADADTGFEPKHLTCSLGAAEGWVVRRLFARAVARGVTVDDPYTRRERQVRNHSDVIRILLQAIYREHEQAPKHGKPGRPSKKVR